MENYTALYSRTGTGGKTVWDAQQYSFFAMDDSQARGIAENYSWRLNHSTWSGPTIGLEKIVRIEDGQVVFERDKNGIHTTSS